jgi:hypothetical protein
MTTPDPDFTPSDAQNGYGKHMASSLLSTLFPILVFAFEHEGLRIPITQLTKALNLENLVFDNLDPKKGIKHEIIALLKCIERYFTHTARSRNAEIGDLQNQIANLQSQPLYWQASAAAENLCQRNNPLSRHRFRKTIAHCHHYHQNRPM